MFGVHVTALHKRDCKWLFVKVEVGLRSNLNNHGWTAFRHCNTATEREQRVFVCFCIYGNEKKVPQCVCVCLCVCVCVCVCVCACVCVCVCVCVLCSVLCMRAVTLGCMYMYVCTCTHDTQGVGWRISYAWYCRKLLKFLAQYLLTYWWHNLPSGNRPKVDCYWHGNQSIHICVTLDRHSAFCLGL